MILFSLTCVVVIDVLTKVNIGAGVEYGSPFLPLPLVV